MAMAYVPYRQDPIRILSILLWDYTVMCVENQCGEPIILDIGYIITRCKRAVPVLLPIQIQVYAVHVLVVVGLQLLQRISPIRCNLSILSIVILSHPSMCNVFQQRSPICESPFPWLVSIGPLVISNRNPHTPRTDRVSFTNVSSARMEVRNAIMWLGFMPLCQSLVSVQPQGQCSHDVLVCLLDQTRSFAPLVLVVRLVRI